MEISVYSTHRFEKDYLLAANNQAHELKLLDIRLTAQTAALAAGSAAVCIFVNDDAGEEVLEKLKAQGVKYLILRSAGYNHVALKKAKALGFRIARVPEYSPYAVAEHTVALMLALNRKLIRAHSRIMELNFSLEGLVGFDMHGKTAGIIGTGKIGCVLAGILHGFGCRIIACDVIENREIIEKYNVEYMDKYALCEQADIISLHLPLSASTHYIIDQDTISRMKKGVMLVNTSRGGLVNTKAVINALKAGIIGFFGMDVYEEESGLFFEDHSEDILQDDTIARLMTFSNVLITSHQAFLTDTALKNIADTTISNINCFASGANCPNEIQ